MPVESGSLGTEQSPLRASNERETPVAIAARGNYSLGPGLKSDGVQCSLASQRPWGQRGDPRRTPAPRTPPRKSMSPPGAAPSSPQTGGGGNLVHVKPPFASPHSLNGAELKVHPAFHAEDSCVSLKEKANPSWLGYIQNNWFYMDLPAVRC